MVSDQFAIRLTYCLLLIAYCLLSTAYWLVVVDHGGQEDLYRALLELQVLVEVVAAPAADEVEPALAGHGAEARATAPQSAIRF